jgi:hypothetical protein
MNAPAYKIQVAMDGVMPLWADLRNMPDFESIGDAQTWITEHDGEMLQRNGVNFRIMPRDYPCAYAVELVKRRAS